MEREDREESADDTREFANDVLGRGQWRAVEQVAHPRFIVSKHGEAGQERGEERVEDQPGEGEALGHRVTRIAERLHASDCCVSGRNHGRGVHEKRREQREGQQTPGERRPGLRAELLAGDGENAMGRHAGLRPPRIRDDSNGSSRSRRLRGSERSS